MINSTGNYHDDGLSDKEILNILFKNYMNYTTTSDNKLFYQETDIANNTNIMGSNVLSDTIPTNPIFDISINSYQDLNNYLNEEFNFSDNWFSDKTEEGSFMTDSATQNVLRLEKIKLNYLGNDTSSFVCFDLSNDNILKNLIPSNYSKEGYSFSLHYHLSGVGLKSVPWLKQRSDLAENLYIGEPVDFGGALFDTKNGIVTFYDVDGDANTVFSDISNSFYLSATKYIGTTGFRTFNEDLNFNSALNVLGDVSMESSLDVSKNLVVHGITTLQQHVSIESTLTVESDVSMESSLDVSNDLTVHQESFLFGDVSMGAHLTVIGDVSMQSSLEVSDNLIVHGKSTLHQDVSMGAGLTVEGDVSMESSLDISNDLTVHQETFLFGDVSMGARLTVMGDVSMQSSLEVSNNLMVHGKSTLHQDVSMESSLDISNDLTVHQESFLFGDVSMGAHLTVIGDVSMQSSLEVSDSLIVHGRTNINQDVSMGAGLIVEGDVSMESSLDVSENLHVHLETTLDGDVSMGSSLEISNNLTVNQDTSLNGNVHIPNHLQIGNSNSISDMSNTKLDVYASSNGGGFNYDGNVTIGNQDHKTATEVSNSDIELTIYGDIRIKDGGNLVIEDISNSSITYLKTETQVTDSFKIIDNDGTSSSLTVNQTHTQSHNIAEFQDNSVDVFVIGPSGESTFHKKSTFHKDVSINSQLDVSGLSVVNDLDVDGSTTVEQLTASKHVLFETTLAVQSDVSMESTLDVSNDLTVHQNTFLFQDVSMGAGLTVMGDVSMESTLDVSGHITTPSYIGIGSVTDPSYSLHIEASDAILLPKGGTMNEGIDGLIRYHTEKKQFEGYSEGAWQGLGGVIDSDLDTKIIADESNNLLFDTSGVQRMIIDSSGNIGIGTDAVNQYKVDISGNVHLTGTITSDSDRRIKSEIHRLSGCLESIQELNGYSFTRVDLEDNGKKHIGVIAQEVETLYPELITAHERTGIKSVNYNGLSAVLIECVKELKTENQSMRERIHSLEQQVRATTENKDN
jgi:VCBS repeat-containing protein